jgi:ubiquinone/menaquinone biosynthesis C-methylase UbiE
MGIMKYIIEQAGNPTGRFGRLFVRSMNRGHNELTQWGLRHLNITSKATILDIGCGGGKTVNWLAKIALDGYVCGVDYSDASVAASTAANKGLIGEGRVEILKASVSSLPFPADMFDVVTAIETCYFWPDFQENLKEIHRVLKPGGMVVLVNEAYRNIKFEKRNSSISKACKFSYYLPSEFELFLREAGFFRIRIEVIEKKNWINITGEK